MIERLKIEDVGKYSELYDNRIFCNLVRVFQITEEEAVYKLRPEEIWLEANRQLSLILEKHRLDLERDNYVYSFNESYKEYENAFFSILFTMLYILYADEKYINNKVEKKFVMDLMHLSGYDSQYTEMLETVNKFEKEEDNRESDVKSKVLSMVGKISRYIKPKYKDSAEEIWNDILSNQDVITMLEKNKNKLENYTCYIIAFVINIYDASKTSLAEQFTTDKDRYKQYINKYRMPQKYSKVSDYLETLHLS